MRTWVEISRKALIHNLAVFRGLIGDDVILAPAVKANAYGHGLVDCAQVFVDNGSDYLCVDALFEAETLRKAGIKIPILIMGYVPLSELKRATELGCDLVVYSVETIKALGRLNLPVAIHLKIETGTHRQGVSHDDLNEMIGLLKRCSTIKLKGVSTHFANLEDRINHQYALRQLSEFEQAITLLENAGLAPRFRHCANTAATLLMPEAHFNFVRTGIGNYGLWPSEKTRKAARRAGVKVALQPALTWKTLVAQVKEVPKGALIGYGCSYAMPSHGQIAVIPVGYYDGYVRLLGNKGYVLIRGQKAPVIGRICMNMFMVDVSKISGVKLEDEVVLLGQQGKVVISAEDLAEWSQTINYEVTTRINERILRYIVA
jgi:alanine racemase